MRDKGQGTTRNFRDPFYDRNSTWNLIPLSYLIIILARDTDRHVNVVVSVIETHSYSAFGEHFLYLTWSNEVGPDY